MSEARTFVAKGLNVQQVVDSLTAWLSAENFDRQVLTGPDGALVIQVGKKGGWRKALGMSTALNVILRYTDPYLVVEIGAGRWADKAIVGAISMVVLWPLAVTSAIGTWQQMKMPERVFAQVESQLLQPRAIRVVINPQKRLVVGAAEKVQVPPGVMLTIKRARTVEHSLSFRHGETSESGVTFGHANILTESARKAIEESLGSTIREAETIEHEVELNGAVSNEYTLTWVDTMARWNYRIPRRTLHVNTTVRVP
jgi:hypothetical protein